MVAPPCAGGLGLQAGPGERREAGPKPAKDATSQPAHPFPLSLSMFPPLTPVLKGVGRWARQADKPFLAFQLQLGKRQSFRLLSPCGGCWAALAYSGKGLGAEGPREGAREAFLPPRLRAPLSCHTAPQWMLKHLSLQDACPLGPRLGESR